MTDDTPRPRTTDEAESASDHDHRDERAEPIPKASVFVSTKRIRRKLVTDTPETARAVPFELSPDRVSSREIAPISIRALERDGWRLEPPAVELTSDFEATELDPPRLRIWENAKLEPIDLGYRAITQPEIGLPPRPLLSVTVIEDRDPTADPDSGNAKRSSSEDSTSEASTPTDDTGADPSQTAASQTDAEQESSASDQLPELDEFLFDIDGGSLDSYDPLCIVAAKTTDEEYKQTLEALCREQFRQLNGGKPLPSLLADGEGETLESTRVENRIISYDDDSSEEYFEFVSEISDDEIRTALREGELDLSKLTARIDEFFSETLGYLLLFADEQYAPALYDYLTSTDDVRETTQILSAQPRPLPEDVKQELVRLAWGNVHIESDSHKLDRLFHTSANAFRDAIEPSGTLEEITARDEGEESRLHYWIKCFTVEALLKRDGVAIQQESRIDLKERIPTETELQGGGNPRPDVYHEPSGEVYEVETLYGTDHKKITRTIDRYEGVNVKRVNVVLPNLTCLRNLDAVLRKTQQKPGEMFHNEVEFWTLDAVERELLPLEDVVSRVADMYDRSEKLW
ncbi:hypothetical protein [Natrialba sp. SSL1]|uniref:hypothetical protein n=1 Tax=Natrialba sp. SSL1 TaxID=1869245 RepID=UPI0008F93334|nr:hypothetical protein [Natrialba sp. SSL1]OIB56172.1 hypothetical protein BBD46_19395 [Natrialba sp. SSL1]